MDGRVLVALALAGLTVAAEVRKRGSGATVRPGRDVRPPSFVRVAAMDKLKAMLPPSESNTSIEFYRQADKASDEQLLELVQETLKLLPREEGAGWQRDSRGDLFMSPPEIVDAVYSYRVYSKGYRKGRQWFGEVHWSDDHRTTSEPYSSEDKAVQAMDAHMLWFATGGYDVAWDDLFQRHRRPVGPKVPKPSKRVLTLEDRSEVGLQMGTDAEVAAYVNEEREQNAWWFLGLYPVSDYDGAL